MESIEDGRHATLRNTVQGDSCSKWFRASTTRATRSSGRCQAACRPALLMPFGVARPTLVMIAGRREWKSVYPPTTRIQNNCIRAIAERYFEKCCRTFPAI